MILGKPYGLEVDWWALGVLIFEMLTKKLPFDSPNRNDLYEKILKLPPDFTLESLGETHPNQFVEQATKLQLQQQQQQQNGNKSNKNQHGGKGHSGHNQQQQNQQQQIKKSKFSKNSQDLVRKLLEKDVSLRLGSKNGAEEIKGHPFFRGINWTQLFEKKIKPPFIPESVSRISSRALKFPPSHSHIAFVFFSFCH